MNPQKFNSPLSRSSYPQASTYLDYIQSRRMKLPEKQDKILDSVDEKMKRINDIILQIAETDVPVLITGESGVGKEVVARAIHDAKSKKDIPFVAVNCAAMPASLLESELFGFEKGSFTGAAQRHVGKFETANHGTILLDEITEMDISLQAKLLRVLQEKEIDPIGSRHPIKISTRVIATTNRDIVKAVAQGKFRQDLYYRLYVIHLDIPPLRERPKDIEHLSSVFISQLGKNLSRPNMRLSPESLEKLKNYSWPGNVRELQNIIHRAMILSQTDVIQSESLLIEGEAIVSQSMEWISSLPIGRPLQLLETHFILETLKAHDGNRTHAAKTLGISLRTLRNKINEFRGVGLDVPEPGLGRISK